MQRLPRATTRIGLLKFGRCSGSLLLGAICCWPMLATAESFAPQQVAADARWVIHLDFDLLRDTKLGATLLDADAGSAKLVDALAEIQRQTGIDPRAQVCDVTIYDTDFTPDSAVLVFRLREATRDELLALLAKSVPDYKSFEHQGETVYYWRLPEVRKEVFAAYLGETTVLLCGQRSLLLTAIDVLQGNAGHLAADSPLAADNKRGTVLLARARDVDADDSPFRNNLIRDAKYISLVVGEYDRQVFGKVLVATGSADSADQVRAAAIAFKTILQMNLQQQPRGLSILEKLQVATADQTVIMDWRLPVDDVAEALTILTK